MTRNEQLMIARQITEDAPVSEVRYTDRELDEQAQAYADAIGELATLRVKWRIENDRQVARKVVAAEWLALKAPVGCRRPGRVVKGPEIVTSASLQPEREEPFLLAREEPFPLRRPTLKSKAPKRRCIPALRSFFQAASIFLHS